MSVGSCAINVKLYRRETSREKKKPPIRADNDARKHFHRDQISESALSGSVWCIRFSSTIQLHSYYLSSPTVKANIQECVFCGDANVINGTRFDNDCIKPVKHSADLCLD